MELMYSEFAYSVHMQIMLAVITFIETFLSMYMIANVIMTVFKVTANKKQKLLFTFINGSLLQTAFIYGIYLWGGMESFTPLLYLLVVNPNPIAAMIYYYSAQIIFRLSNERSVKLMSYMFMLWAMKVTIGRFLQILLNTETGHNYNYMLDAMQQMSVLTLFFFIYCIVQYFLKRSQVSLKFSQNMLFNKNRELVVYFLGASFIFSVNVFIPLMIVEQVTANIIVILILLLYIVINICIDIVKYNQQAISNRDVHISALFRGMQELRGIKHDFNNILHTYSGYLELKEYEGLKNYHASLISATSHSGNIMELAQKMQENPTIISLLINKLEQAEKMSVNLLITLKCNLDNMHIDNMDIARILSSLLDNAILAASESDQRKAYFTIELKSNGSKLIIITNSTSGKSNQRQLKRRENEIRGLQIVRSVLNKYGNCSYQIEYREQEMTVYIELKETS